MKKVWIKWSLVVLLFVTAASIQPEPVAAQCSMCRMATEKGGEETKGINNGILYMLGMPYFIVGAIGYVWWRNRRKEE